MDSLRQYFEQLARGEILERKTGRFVLKKLNSGELFSYARESTLGEVREARTLHKLDCGHLIGAIGPQEYVGDCGKCNASCCFRPDCSARCERCRILLCPEHQYFLEGISYCRTCRNIALLKQGTLLGLRGLHTVLSKEI